MSKDYIQFPSSKCLLCLSILHVQFKYLKLDLILARTGLGLIPSRMSHLPSYLHPGVTWRVPVSGFDLSSSMGLARSECVPQYLHPLSSRACSRPVGAAWKSRPRDVGMVGVGKWRRWEKCGRKMQRISGGSQGVAGPDDIYEGFI